MEDITFFERIKLLFSLISSSPFFVIILFLLIAATLTLVLYKKSNNRNLKIIVTVLYFISFILIIFNYGSSFTKFFDNLVTKLFTYLYFPSIIAYLCLMIIGILILVKMILRKEKSKFIVISNVMLFTISVLLFVLSIDIIVKGNIDIFEKTSIYNNETLMVLIQANTTVYLLWFITLLIKYLANKLIKKLDYEEIPKEDKEEIKEVRYLTDEEFNTSFENYKKKHETFEEIKKLIN